MGKKAERPRSEQEILAAQEVAINTGWRRENLHRDIEARLGKFDELSRAVQTAEARHRQAEGKYARLQEVARESGHEEAFSEELRQCRVELLQLAERVDTAVTQLRPVEVKLLTLASEYAALDGDIESSLGALQEATEHFEGLVGEIEQTNAEALERDQHAFAEAQTAFEQALDEVKDEFRVLIGWDLNMNTETSDSRATQNFDRVQQDASNAGERFGDLKRKREREGGESQAYVSLDGGDKKWRAFRDIDNGEGGRKNYTADEIAKGDFVTVRQAGVERVENSLKEHDKKKPGIFGIFGGNKQWEAEKTRIEGELARQRENMELAQKEQAAVQAELQRLDAEVEAQGQKVAKLQGLEAKMNDVRSTRNTFKSAQSNLGYTQGRINRQTGPMREALRNIQQATKRLNLDIDHPIMERVRAIEVGQAEAEVA